jgi:DNA-binding CsgD family transcriptional regulator
VRIYVGTAMDDLRGGMTNADIARALRMVGAWTAALQGAGDLGRAAEFMMEMMPARHIRASRIIATTGEVKRIFASNAAPRRDIGRMSWPSLPQAGCVVMTPGADAAVIVFQHDAAQCDILEVGLSQPLNERQRDLLDLLAVALADGWMRRQPGLISGRIVDLARRNVSRKNITVAAPILDYTNPYALSRSEFRVCAMIGQGLTAKHIARELRLSEATVRSHQRAIYAKTALSGQIEVMFHLQTHPTAQSLLHGVPAGAAC